MRQEHLEGKKNAAVACRLSMLLWLRRGSDHPWLAGKFWEERNQLAALEEGQIVPSDILHKLDELCSAKTEELLKIVQQHPGKHFLTSTVFLAGLTDCRCSPLRLFRATPS